MHSHRLRVSVHLVVISIVIALGLGWQIPLGRSFAQGEAPTVEVYVPLISNHTNHEAGATATPTRTVSPQATATVQAPTATVPTAQIERWSAAATWGGNVPQADDAVTIAAGKTVLLDVSPPPLDSLTINGTLIFAEQDLSLSAGWIMVHGRLEIGTADTPFTHRATITLTGAASADIMGMGSRFLGAMGGGTIDLYGETRTSWTRLNATAHQNGAQLTLAEASDWRVGDRIVVASTDYDYAQDETFTITTVSGKQITLDASLRYMHWGELQSYNGKTVDERAEVALLSRNILIQGDPSAESDGFGGHIMIMSGSTLHLDGVTLHRMGQRGRLGRYPIHFHLMGDDARGSFVKNSTIHRSFNRCMTIHGSNGVLLQNNVAYDAAGHCFFLEDGAEVDNVLEGNLGLGIYRPEEEDALLESDMRFLGPAVYWITNPDNIVRNNVAAGSQGSGFWIALPEHPTGPSFNDAIWPQHTPLSEFAGNVAHSNGSDGLHVDNGPDGGPEGNIDTTYYVARVDPADEESAIVPVTFSSFTAYKNRNRGVWLRGNSHILQDAILADNAIGATFASDETVARGNLYVGETANSGTPEEWMIDNEQVGLDGRSLPRFWEPEFPIRGFEFYDGKVGVETSFFTHYEPNAQRQAAALSYLDFTDFSISSANFASGLSFDAQTNRVYLATRPNPPNPTEGTEDGYRSAVFLDSDGSVTGTANRFVVVDNEFLRTSNCTKHDGWNAWICHEEYLGLSVRTDDNELASVSLARETGATHTMFGSGSAPSNYFRTVLMPGHTYTLTFDDHVPNKFYTVLHEGAGRWVQLHVPYGQVPRVTRYGTELAPVATLADLTNLTRSGFYYDGSAGGLHIKLMADVSYEQLEIENTGASPATGSGTD